jgi:segregation and condensation protein A
LAGLALIAPPPEPPPEVMPRTITLTERAALIREALRAAPAIVLQDLLRGVHDRVVVAVTFLALLELVKRREIVVEQEEPWGPIVARATDDLMDDAPLDETLESFA